MRSVGTVKRRDDDHQSELRLRTGQLSRPISVNVATQLNWHSAVERGELLMKKLVDLRSVEFDGVQVVSSRTYAILTEG